MTSSPLLNVDDLAEQLGVTPRFVRTLVHERRIPFHKVGKFVRFSPDDVDHWLQEAKVEPIAL